MALDRKCVICPDKHHYKYCNNCSGYNPIETWRFVFCSQNCREIYRILSDYSSKQITIEEAKEALRKCDLSDLEFYQKSIKKSIQDILGLEEVTETTEDENIEEKEIIKTEENIESAVANITEEPVVAAEEIVKDDSVDTLNVKTNVSNDNKYYPKKHKNRKK